MNPEEVLAPSEARGTIRSDFLNSRPSLALDNRAVSHSLPQPQHWYALHTRSRHEKVVNSLLCEKGYETFLPLTTKRSLVTLRRFREAQVPLFTGYTFARIPASYEKFHEVRATTGVAGIVGGRSGPAFIPDTEIESIQTLLAEKVNCNLGSSFEVGQRVVVTCGPLQGVRGEILRRKNRQLFVVKIPLIQRSLEVDLRQGELEALAAIPETDSFPGD